MESTDIKHFKPQRVVKNTIIHLDIIVYRKYIFPLRLKKLTKKKKDKLPKLHISDKNTNSTKLVAKDGHGFDIQNLIHKKRPI